MQIQKNNAVERLNQIIHKGKFAISYLNFFNKLRKDLKQNYDIIIEEDIQSFSQLLNDFKEHEYDASKIIKEYLKSLSIKLELKTSEADLQLLQNQRNELIKQADYLQGQAGQH